MKTVGEILKKARLEKNIAIEEAARITRILPFYLKFLEEDEISQFSSFVTARGFIKNYAEFLGIPVEPALAAFRRDFGQDKKGKIIPQGMVEPLNQGHFFWKPKIMTALGFGILILGLIAWLSFQYLSLSKKPPLQVSSPVEGERMTEAKIDVIGQTEPDCQVFVNTNPVFVSTKGEFRYKVELFSGENKIMIEAKNRAGKISLVERVVFKEKTESQ